MATKFSEHLRNIYEYSKGSVEAAKALEPYRVKTTGYLEEGQGSLGGFTTPVEAYERILGVALEDSIVRPRATVIQMESDAGTISRIVDTSHASNVLGGITISWTDEGAALSESNPAFGALGLRAKKMTGLCYTSSEWLEDSIVPPEDLLIQAFGKAIAFYADDEYFNGSGVDRPLGILNSPALIPVSRAGTNLAWGDLVNMNERLLPMSERRALWVINSDAQGRLYGVSPGAGFVSNDRILRKDYEFSEKVPGWGHTGDCGVYDFSYYLVANRDLIISASDACRFANDEIAWRFIYRGDGVPIPAAVTTPMRGSQTQSPFVVLTGGVSSSSSSGSSSSTSESSYSLSVSSSSSSSSTSSSSSSSSSTSSSSSSTSSSSASSSSSTSSSSTSSSSSSASSSSTSSSSTSSSSSSTSSSSTSSSSTSTSVSSSSSSSAGA